ncbi:addiction module protein [Desulfonatronum thiodismutans]|uniref:addiction module protein n=1 Tax=Desulfonatronum thiodismutans TaxID=159290 RepID=UPI0004ABEC2A|nr:addiction module protein [Desulfonatronum thiodismutans]
MHNLELREIPVDQRIRIVEEIWDSIAADQQLIEISDAQRELLNIRLDAFESDLDYGTDAKIVIERVREKLCSI